MYITIEENDTIPTIGEDQMMVLTDTFNMDQGDEMNVFRLITLHPSGSSIDSTTTILIEPTQGTVMIVDGGLVVIH